jgi:hypothetical protein
MSKPSESTLRSLPRWKQVARPGNTDLLICALAVATLLLAAPARAGVTHAATGLPPAVTAEPDPAATPVYQLRCWQNGRLLFEEHLARLPSDGATYGLRIGGSDRNQRPVYVAETQNATCLIRSVVPERTWPRGQN